MRPIKALLFAGLLIALLVLTIGASWLGPGHWMAATVRPVEPPPHIPPGRENVVMTFLGPVMKNGFAGLGVANILLEKSEIRLLLAVKTDSSSAQKPNSCPLPEWARAPGMLVIVPERVPAPQCPESATCGIVREKDLTLAWAACSSVNTAQSAQEWISALAQRDHSGIWETPRPTVETTITQQAGLLTPIVLATGLDKVFVARMLLFVSLLICGLAGLVLRWKMGRSTSAVPPSNRNDGWKIRWGILGALVIVGIGLRIHAAATLPRDLDEGFHGEYIQNILSNDHDSWVHPPLYRAVHKAFFDTANLTEKDALWKLRVPSLFFSILALCFLAVTIGVAKPRRYAELPFAFAALSPIAIRDSVLARPYGLAMFGATLCLIAISSRDLAEDESEDAFSWFVALVALGMTIWTDLVTSLLIGSFVLARWLHPHGFSKKTNVWGRTITAISIVVWAIPFAIGLPGSVHASRDLGWPFHTASSSVSAFQQVSTIAWEMIGIRDFGNRPDGAAILVPCAAFVFVAVMAIRWTRLATAIGLALMFAALTAASSHIGMRARNVVFLPIALAFVASLVVARAPWEAIREKARRMQSK